jgi:hypothetical protein
MNDKIEKYENVDIVNQPTTGLEMAVEPISSRAIAEVQAAIIVAKRFPRDESAACDRILTACARSSLAERAIFSYARGGTDVTGVTIRLAEEVARQWKNIDYGWRTIEQRYDSSVIEAYAIDLEANVRRVAQFTVSHRRHTKKGDYLMTDPRDIYETQANQASRRVRACILALIPGDIIDSAREQCEQTMSTNIDLTPEKIKALVNAFSEFGVTIPQIERRIQRKLDTIQPAQVLQLRKIYNSLRDGMSDRTAWFEDDLDKTKAESTSKGLEGVREQLKNKE